MLLPLFAATQTGNPPPVNPETFSQNRFIADTGKAETLKQQIRNVKTNDAVFWIIAAMVLLLALLKFFYTRYFQTLFRVFFNTSLRQSQLTDQLQQSKLPSLLFNIFFFLSAGMYIWLTTQYYTALLLKNKWLFALLCVAAVAAVYSFKTVFLKFAGWLTGSNDVVREYVFVVFLINKIIGIALVPFIIFVAFAEMPISNTVLIISFFVLILLFFLRFFKAYGLFQNKLSLSRFHFFILIAAVEVVPLVVIYKATMLLFSKNL